VAKPAECPYCLEAVPPNARTCPHCDESLVPQATGLSGVKLALLIVGVVLIGGCGVFAMIAAIAIPNLIEARKHGNEAAAIGALKTISTSQMLYREGDKDADGELDYGTLTELGQHGLIDSVLAGGTKQGYFFEVRVSPDNPEFDWMAVANPAVPGTTGSRAFATDSAGIIWYTKGGTIPLPADAQLPEGLTPVGR